MVQILRKIVKIWPSINNVLTIPQNEEEYNKLVEIFNALIDEVGEDENHPLSRLMETVGALLEVYEEQNIEEPEGNPNDALKYLMKEHDLKQSDLTEIGSQGVVSEILSGKRELNTRQIKLLSRRFHVSPSVFIGKIKQTGG